MTNQATPQNDLTVDRQIYQTIFTIKELGKRINALETQSFFLEGHKMRKEVMLYDRKKKFAENIQTLRQKSYTSGSKFMLLAPQNLDAILEYLEAKDLENIAIKSKYFFKLTAKDRFWSKL